MSLKLALCGGASGVPLWLAANPITFNVWNATAAKRCHTAMRINANADKLLSLVIEGEDLLAAKDAK